MQYMGLIQNLFFKNAKITTFSITRLAPGQVKEQVFFIQGKHRIDITKHHGMICLDPFCVAVWLPYEETKQVDTATGTLNFTGNGKLNAKIRVSLIEKLPTEKGELLLYKMGQVKNYQLKPIHRQVLFRYFLRSKKNTYHHRKMISALYSYPRNIIIVSYKDDEYYNIFPMDIHSYIAEEKLYLLGLRTTNVTLNKILEAKKAVVCDTDTVGIETVYMLGKHPSADPTRIEDMPFAVSESEKFGFYVPDFTGSYKEIEIIANREMGYHMLMIGKVVNEKRLKPESASLYHVGFLQFQQSQYQNIEGLY
jgi:flavin reductase (DIM6/NTAB) family NADH-FMN oxidoreductase RutF